MVAGRGRRPEEFAQLGLESGLGRRAGRTGQPSGGSMMAVMNRYGVMARSLGALVADPVRGLGGERAGGGVLHGFGGAGSGAGGGPDRLDGGGDPDPPGQGYLARAGRLRAIQQAAEEQVLAELGLLPPEQAEGEQEVEDDEAGWAAARAQMNEGICPWIRATRFIGIWRTSR